MAALIVRAPRSPLAPRAIAHASARSLKQASARARAFADAAILSQLSKRLQQLDDLVGKLAFSLREIKGTRDRSHRG